MNQRSILILITLAFFCQCGQKGSSDDRNADNLIIEGQGVGKFRVGKTKLDDIVTILGSEYEEIKYENFRTEAYFEERGISFYYQGNDSTKTIYCVILRQPFAGRTTKGIGLSDSMTDVLKLYGPPELATCETCETWTTRYHGIEFEIERDKSLPKFPLDEEVHLKKRISKIIVYKNSQ